MGTPFMSEVKIVSFNFPPKGWAFCNGQFLPINQNQALFSLLGTTFGGNGQTTFALPDLRGRVAASMGAGFVLGQVGGQTAHTLTISEMAAHSHFMQASPTNGDQVVPTNNYLGPGGNLYAGSGSMTTLTPGTVGNVGASQPHNNMQPYLVLNYIIALIGAFPTQN